MQKGISSVVAVILLLLVSVSLAASTYVFLSSTVSTTEEAGSERVEQITQQLSTCVVIDSVYDNRMSVRNCGTGVVTNQSLFVFVDGNAVNFSMDKTQIIEDESGTVILSGWFNTPLGSHTVKLTSGTAAVTKPVKVIENPELNKSLVAWWKFEEGAGTVILDSGPNRYDGNTCTGVSACTITAGTWTTGKVGLGYSLSGSNFLSLGNRPLYTIGTGDYTVDLWTKPSSATQDGGCVIDKGSFFNIASPQQIPGFDMCFSWFSKIMYWNVYDASTYTPINSGLNAPFADWVRVTGIRRGGNVELWLNGFKRFSITYPQTNIASNTYNLFIGKSRVSEKMAGLVDEVRLFNKSFSPDEMISMIPA